MKITRVHLKDFHQFKDLDIDLTYPKGHKKEGEPLDKVCIIGQSGTGKTTLLKIIGGHTYTLGSLFEEYNHSEFKNIRVYKKLDALEAEIRVVVNPKSLVNTYKWENYSLNKKAISFEEAISKQQEYLKGIKTQFIYFPSDLKYDDFPLGTKSLADKRIIDFRKDNASSAWTIVSSEIESYQEEELRLRQNISKIAEEKGNMKEIHKAVGELDEWRKKALNPINKLAEECLDPVLKHFSLRVSRDLSIEKKEDFGFIKLEDIDGNPIPHALLSTGSKQVLLTALPLYLLKPEKTLILFDEPERSLYPSIQKMIVDFYQSLTKDSQFFYATHSPIIASSFEPWEIIELKFDKEGHVYQELYYDPKKERHIDNYTLIPSYMTYDLILSKIFDLENIHSDERSEKMTEVLMYRNQLISMKEKGNTKTDQFKDVYAKYRDLAGKLFWDFDLI